jgi:hypothetical protein
MFGFLGEIVSGITNLPYLLLNLVITSINGWIELLGALLKLVMAALPGFPERPHLTGVGIEWLSWFMPLTAMVGVFTVMLASWLIWMAYTVIAKKIGVIS